METQAVRAGSDDPIFAAADAVGDAWSWLIIEEVLANGVGRFNELQRSIGISRQTLSARLDNLVAVGVLVREDSGRGRRVDYRATECGHDFLMCLAVASRFGVEWCGADDPGLHGAIHTACEASFSGELRCEACSQIIDARAVRVDAATRASSELISSRRHRAPDLGSFVDKDATGLTAALAITGDRWTSLVVRECFFGTRRFDHFVEHLGVATNVLSQRLHALVDKGVLTKEPYQWAPLRHEYRLTDKGRALYPVPLSLLAWGSRWFNELSGIDLTHKPCGSPLRAFLACASCGHHATTDDLSYPAALARP